MKQPKKPTLAQKKKIYDAGLNWRNWAVVDDLEDRLILMNKITRKKEDCKEIKSTVVTATVLRIKTYVKT